MSAQALPNRQPRTYKPFELFGDREAARDLIGRDSPDAWCDHVVAKGLKPGNMIGFIVEHGEHSTIEVHRLVYCDDVRLTFRAVA